MPVNRTKKFENRQRAPYELPRLAKEANRYHKRAVQHYIGFLISARKSGDALLQARYFGLWKRGIWKKWLEDNFDGSYETAKAYMRIAKRWDDPRLQEARRLGVTLDSINKVLQILSGRRNVDGTLNSKTTEVDSVREQMRKRFGELLQNLSEDELMVFNEDFDDYWEFLYHRIYNNTCKILGFDLNEFLVQLYEGATTDSEGDGDGTPVTVFNNNRPIQTSILKTHCF